MLFKHISLINLKTKLSDLDISEEVTNKLLKINIITLQDLASTKKSFLINRFFDHQFSEINNILSSYRIRKNFNYKRLINSLKKVDELNIDVEGMRIDLLNNSKSKIRFFFQKINFDENILVLHLSDLLIRENFPDITGYSNHIYKGINLEIRKSLKINDKFSIIKNNVNKLETVKNPLLDYNFDFIISFLLNHNISNKKFLNKYSFNTFTLKNYLLNGITKHQFPLNGWGRRSYELFNDSIKLSLEKHNDLSKTISLDVFTNAMKMNYITFNNLSLIDNDSSALSLSILCFSKNIEIIKDHLLNNLSSAELVLKHGLTKERIRQILKPVLESTLLINSYRYYIKNGFREEISMFNHNSQILNFKYQANDFIRKGDFITYKTEDITQKIHFKIFGHTKYKIYKLDLGEKFFIRNDVYDLFAEDLDNLNNELNSIGLISSTSINNEFLSFFLNNQKIIIKDSVINKNFIYVPQKINLKKIGLLAIDQNINSKGLVDLNEVYRWLKENFPEKCPKSIVIMRSLLLQNNLIFAYGKTGNYQKVSKKGQKTFHTIDLIIEILNKSKFPLHQNEIEELVQKRNPYLKDRGAAMIIDINPDKFIKFVGTGFVGLIGKKYSELPTKLPKKQINNYLRSKPLSIEWVSFEFLINEYKINDFQLIDFIEDSNDYIYLDNLITLSTNDKEKDMLIKKLCKDKKLFDIISNKFLKLNLSKRIKFKKQLREIIKKNYKVELNIDQISKIINFVI